MPRLGRQLTSVAVAVLLAASIVYGSYLPMRKSDLFRQAMGDTGSVHTPAQFAALFSVPLDAPSPMGQGELVRDTTALVLTTIQMNGTPSGITVELVKFVNARFLPILQRGRGMAFVQTLYNLAAIHVIAYVQTRNPAYLAAAEKLFLRGLEASPKRPEFLYGLLDVYFLAENTEKAQAVADTILRQWPDDQRTRSALAAYLARPGAP